MRAVILIKPFLEYSTNKLDKVTLSYQASRDSLKKKVEVLQANQLDIELILRIIREFEDVVVRHFQLSDTQSNE